MASATLHAMLWPRMPAGERIADWVTWNLFLFCPAPLRSRFFTRWPAPLRSRFFTRWPAPLRSRFFTRWPAPLRSRFFTRWPAPLRSRFGTARQQHTRRRPEVVHWRTSTRRRPGGWRVSKRNWLAQLSHQGRGVALHIILAVFLQSLHQRIHHFSAAVHVQTFDEHGW